VNPGWRLTTVALITQGALGALGLVATIAGGVPLPWGLDRPVVGVLAGVAAAALLAWLNYRWLHDPQGVFRRVRAAVDDVLVPTFGAMSRGQIALVSVAAALGEEIFFRGWLQPVIGWVPAAVAFGAAHVAGARMLALGVWATGMGLVLGGLVIVTGGLLASMVAHACYDMAAFHYLGELARTRGDEGA
jgi:membrane protease YdiL (CAAX protease family)